MSSPPRTTSTPNPHTAGFHRVLANFRARLTKAELDNFKICDLNDVRQAIVNIQYEQEKRKDMMGFSRILGFLEAMDQFGKVVEVFLNASEFLAFVWGPLKFLLQVASSWAESFDTLLDAYQEISEQIPLLLQYQNVFQNNPHMTSVLEMIYKDILEFHQQALRVFGKSVLKQMFHAVWKDFNARFKHLIMNLQRHKWLIESQANVLEIQASQVARAAAEKAFDADILARSNEQRLAVRTWLSARNVKLDHEACISMRAEYPTTGLWILEKPAIEKWHDKQDTTVPLVWLHGIPGAGKTILTSLVIEKSRSQSETIAAYFYCKYKDRERNNFASVVRALLLQLVTQSKDSDLLQVLYEASVDSGEESLESQTLCTELLSIGLGTIPNETIIHLVVDGLDECDPPERRKIISCITTVIKDYVQPGKIRAMFTSQPETDIRSLLRKASIIRVTESDNSGDIAEYSRNWCAKIQTKFMLPEDKRDLIHSFLCERAEGMFLFAKLVLRNLHSQTSRAKLYEALSPNEFPTGLNQAYERIIERIEKNKNISERDQAMMLLGWVVTAKRPLTWPEIQGAVSIDLEQETVDFEERQLVVDIKDLCGSLVERLAGNRIELVHTSAKLYLAQSSHIRLPEAEGRVATICLQYLTLPAFVVDPGNIQQVIKNVKSGFFAFHNYAVLHWVDHLQAYLETFESIDLENLENLSPICEEFFDQYGPEENDDIQEHIQSLPSTLALKESCRRASHHLSFEFFIMLIAHAKHLRQKDDSFAGLGELGYVVQVARESLESELQAQDSTQEAILPRYYGENMFLCPRHQCYYFHEGFQDHRLRQEHIHRHERPYCCKEEGCSRAQTGFCTDAALQKHIKKNHVDAKIEIFVKPKPKRKAKAGPRLEQERKRREKKTSFSCDLCSRYFTRASTLAEHVRTHTGERPFACDFCDQRFARVKDCQRHEAIHTRRDTFACNGVLDSGMEWGCGKMYTRADALARHFNSSLGQNCLQPLSAQEDGGKVHMSPQTAMSFGDNAQAKPISVPFDKRSEICYRMVPAAVFSQFPEFKNLDWQALAELPPESEIVWENGE